jgi:hypothetical protein
MDLGDLHELAVLSGQVLPSVSFPYSGAIVLSTLERIQPGASGETIDAIASRIGDLSGADRQMVNITLDASYEHYFRPSYALSLREMLAKIDPLAVLTLSYQLDLSTVLFINAIFQREYLLNDPVDNVFRSLPGNPITLENNDVRQGYFSYTSPQFSFIIGRQDVQIGPSPFSSLVVSPEIPFLDALQWRLHLGSMSMTMIVSTLENRQAAADVTIPSGSPYGFGRTVILHNIHYFEYDLGFLRLGIGGQVIITREDNAFQASDFFPVFSWHNANIIPNNLTLTLDASLVPFPGFEAYAQFGFDDINTNGIGSGDAGIPTIHAGLAGLSWRTLHDGYSLEVGAEAGYTHYLWGSYEDDIPLARAIYRMNLDDTNQWLPLNSPFGPGTAWVLLEARAATPWMLDLRYSARLLFQKPGVDLAVTPYEADPAIEAQPMELTFRTGLAVRFTPWKWITLTLEPELYVESGTVWAELTVGAGSRVGR